MLDECFAERRALPRQANLGKRVSWGMKQTKKRKRLKCGITHKPLHHLLPAFPNQGICEHLVRVTLISAARHMHMHSMHLSRGNQWIRCHIQTSFMVVSTRSPALPAPAACLMPRRRDALCVGWSAVARSISDTGVVPLGPHPDHPAIQRDQAEPGTGGQNHYTPTCNAAVLCMMLFVRFEGTVSPWPQAGPLPQRNKSKQDDVSIPR